MDCYNTLESIRTEKSDCVTICEVSGDCDSDNVYMRECGNGEKMQNSICCDNVIPLTVAAELVSLRKFGFVKMWAIFWLLLIIETFDVESLNVTRICSTLFLVLCE